MDKINIKNLELFAKHGVFKEENLLGQKFIVSAVLYVDIREAGKTDDLNKSCDYGQICCTISNFVEKNTYNLIETVAEKLAEKLLIQYTNINKVSIEIKKPWAPISAHIETVSVEIERQRHISVIAFGSNIGDKEEQINFAIKELNSIAGCRVIKTSPFISTAPYGYLEQDDFLNGCLLLETLMPPLELLELLHDIESKAKRERTIHWGPRTLDLDIIFYDDTVVSHENLIIPHIDMHNRKFVLEPLNEIAPYWIHPIKRKTVCELLKELDMTETKPK